MFKKHASQSHNCRSHVGQFGDLEMGAHYYVGEFVGTERLGAIKKRPNSSTSTSKSRLRPITDAVPSPDVPLHILRRRISLAKDEKVKAKLTNELRLMQKNRAFLDDVVEKIVKIVVLKNQHHLLSSSSSSSSSAAAILKEKRPIRNYFCYERVVRHFSRFCAPFSHNDYALRKVQTFVNLCEFGAETESVLEAVHHVCAHNGPLKGVL